MTQEDLARRIGSKQPAIARIERGRTQVSAGTLVKLAEALDSTVRIQMEPMELIDPANLERPWWERAAPKPERSFRFEITIDVDAFGVSGGALGQAIPEADYTVLDSRRRHLMPAKPETVS